MAFVCTVSPDSMRADICRRGSEVLVNTPIGFDDTDPINYSLLVGLSPAPSAMEYFFVILKIDGENYTEEQIWDSRLVGDFVSSADRALIKNLLLAVTARLLKTVEHDTFFMATYLPDLSNRALEKYHDLCHVFVNAGYKVTKADPYNGNLMWWAERES